MNLSRLSPCGPSSIFVRINTIPEGRLSRPCLVGSASSCDGPQFYSWATSYSWGPGIILELRAISGALVWGRGP
jgi:hypothetical protein